MKNQKMPLWVVITWFAMAAIGTVRLCFDVGKETASAVEIVLESVCVALNLVIVILWLGRYLKEKDK